VITRPELERDVLIVTCAISAGIHAALAPEHFEERSTAGIGFVLSAALLAVVAVALTLRPADVHQVTAAAALMAGLLASYAFATTTGVPVLHPDVEPIDGLALGTKVVESVGLLVAVALLGHSHRQAPIAMHLRSKGPLT
jgi:hypothetical protein